MLRWSKSYVVPALRSYFGAGRLGTNAAVAAVKTHAVVGNIVDNGPVVNVGNARIAHIDHRAIVIKPAAVPVTSLISTAPVAIAVVDSAVEADCGTPVTGAP
jgi:hypothetical protein